jgi:deoxyribodipyrimidine photo-lyase
VSTAILWLRRDLRLHDHPALQAARDGADRLIAVFCFDGGLLRGRHASGPRTRFMLECLTGLDEALRERGSRLFVRHGDPATELSQLALETGASTLHLSADVGPFARARQRQVKRALEAHDIGVTAHPGLFAVDALEPIRTGSGAPYTVFTPFYGNRLTQPRRDVLGAPASLPEPGRTAAAGTLPTPASLGLADELVDPMPGGERAGRAALRRFLAGPVEGYEDGRNLLTGESVSRLSAYLHFGCLSPREIEQRLSRGAGAEAFRRQLCWRDFYAHVLGHFPANAHSEFQDRYRGMSWSHAEKRFQAWCDGRTGFPTVDAAMRQLRREGWIHYVPELTDVPDEYLAEPWTMPDDAQRECGCVIGRDYPEPIVDHAEARRDALDRYRVTSQ